mmetsp:Transcript_25962/g.42611  ORF Transcript_25962/g.42611 Transcript_25962/m.42611 type:complete len:385 (-) Transcript_25962:634-1788(-)
MNRFTPLDFSSSGRPALLQGEVEYLTQGRVAIDNGDKHGRWPEANVTLTTHRVLYITEADGKRSGKALSLFAIADVETKTGMFQSDKIVLHVRSPSPNNPSSGQHENIVRLVFGGGHVDSFTTKLRSVLQSRPWEASNTESSSMSAHPKAFSTAHAGVTGIIRTTQQRDELMERSMGEAFSHITKLMDKAREMVALAERFKSTASATATSSEETAFQNMLLEMGIASPVTKETAGDDYHRELARELSDFLTPVVSKTGGMLPLTDAYCIVNRARGTALLSPDDMYEACVICSRLNLPLRTRRFDSGVIVVHAQTRSDEEMAAHIKSLVEAAGSMTPLDASLALSIPLVLAKEELLIAERAALLARDESVEGLRFYPNQFPVYCQ